MMRSNSAGIFNLPATTMELASWSIGPGFRDKRLHKTKKRSDCLPASTLTKPIKFWLLAF